MKLQLATHTTNIQSITNRLESAYCDPTCSLTTATLPLVIASKFSTKKWIVVCPSTMSRERVVKTFLGVSCPPVTVNTEKMKNIRSVRDATVKARLDAWMIPPWKMILDSLLCVYMHICISNYYDIKFSPTVPHGI